MPVYILKTGRDIIGEPLGPLTYELDGLSGGPLIRLIADQIFDIVTEAYNVGCHIVAILYDEIQTLDITPHRATSCL